MLNVSNISIAKAISLQENLVDLIGKVPSITSKITPLIKPVHMNKPIKSISLHSTRKKRNTIIELLSKAAVFVVFIYAKIINN